MTTDSDGYLSHRQILVVMGGLTVGLFLAALDQSIVGTALPRITSDLGGFSKLSWVVTAYMLTSTASTPLWGKISDLYGRRLLFQVAIVIFVIGSLASGLSQDINQLIAFRAVQGLGGGGLMALALAIVGDVIPPRERGRYQAYFALTFGVASVLGPVLGGFFADGPGWEWIFFINVPLGIAAFAVTTAALRMPHVRRDHSIDYLGAAVIVASVSSLLLYTAWAGPERGWGDPVGLGLLVCGLLLAVVFVLVELRATEPIIPMRLFRNSIFSLSNTFGFLIGTAMFGSLIFLPVYLQVVQGMSPTNSGLAMLPMIAGIFTTSLSAGQVMSRTGRYRVFPPLGAALVLLALALLSQVGVDTPYWYAGLAMYLFGCGLGLCLQIMVVVVQNAVDRSDMGVATSSVAFFRQMGGAFGTALFGAILTSRLAVHLGDLLPPGSGAQQIDTDDTSAIAGLPERLRLPVLEAFSQSIDEMFLTAIPLVLVAGIVAVFIKEIPLATRQAPSGEPAREDDRASSASATSSPETSSGNEPGSEASASAASSPTAV
ncbi:MAG TPA: MDR family MFS transporter [Marmoricola sp.]|nr:MDR family MFS transporter [Marmoricola sp.]